MTTETPPEDWVLLEAATRFTWKVLDMDELRNIHQKPKLSCEHGYRALCDMIAKHEKPLVDRKLLCAREATKYFESKRPTMDGYVSFDLLEPYVVYAIELYEEGFGK